MCRGIRRMQELELVVAYEARGKSQFEKNCREYWEEELTVVEVRSVFIEEV